MSVTSGVNGLTKGLILGVIGATLGGAGFNYIVQRVVRDTVNEQIQKNNEGHKQAPRSKHQLRQLATS